MPTKKTAKAPPQKADAKTGKAPAKLKLRPIDEAELTKVLGGNSGGSGSGMSGGGMSGGNSFGGNSSPQGQNVASNSQANSGMSGGNSQFAAGIQLPTGYGGYGPSSPV